jgi:signal transduction histidine kinase
MKSRQHHQAGFFWQALLIAAPLVILAAVSLHSLREDKASIERDARDRARSLARSLAIDLGEHVTSLDLGAFVRAAPEWLSGKAPNPALIEAASGANDKLRRELVNSRTNEFVQLQCLLVAGKIQNPIDYSPLPAPPDWTRRLTSEQARLWRAAEGALFQRKDLSRARNAVRALMHARLPEPARASAQFSLLLLEEARGPAADWAKRFLDLARRYPEELTEAGTPIADLALIQALRHSTAGHLPDGFSEDLYRRVLQYPSFLTPALLEAASGVSADEDVAHTAWLLMGVWIAQEEARGLLHALLRRPIDPTQRSEIWLEEEGLSFVVFCSPTASQASLGPQGAATHITFIPALRLEKAFQNALSEGRDPIPAYARAVIELGGRRWPVTQGLQARDRSGSTPAVELASAEGQLDIGQTLPGWSTSLYGNRLLTAVRADVRGAPIPNLGFLNKRPFTVSLELSNPDLLFAGYRRQLFLAYGLILSAAAAALVGLVSAWRAFQRQVRLAEMTSNFVSSVSHELRAPLASVRLMAESLEQGRVTEDEKQRDYFRLIVQECRRLSSLVENVLDFSRIRQGRKRYEFEPVDLVALVRQTVKLMEPNAAEHQVNLCLLDLPPWAEQLQPCWDGQAVQQALVNLIDNAIKHSPLEAVVKISLRAIRGEAPAICFLVEDQGQGIPPDEQEKIFEPFYRVGSELRRQTKGVGIGLSIVKHVAEAHGGRISVQALPEKGSCFILELPVTSKLRADAGGRR